MKSPFVRPVPIRVISAQAGIPGFRPRQRRYAARALRWIPACAGMTAFGGARA
jgi:hypothetical protein